MPFNSNDPRPQARIRTVSGPNQPAPAGVYVDTNITKRNPDNGDVPEVKPDPSGLRTLGDVRKVYTNDQKDELDAEVPPENADVPPTESPSPMAIEKDEINISRPRDYYRNDGMIGQQFFGHSGS